MADAGKGEWVVALTGASGQAYGLRVISLLARLAETVHVVASERAVDIARLETSVELTGDGLARIVGPAAAKRVAFHRWDDWSAPMASGADPFLGVAVVPCSMGTLGRVAAGVSGTLIERAVDVALKEGRKTVLVTRETPLNQIHLENLLRMSRAGAVVLPACPGFYDRPKGLDDLVEFVARKTVSALGLPLPPL